MSDPELIIQLTKAVREDPVKPMLDQKFNPTDPIDIEIVLHECDFAVEHYMEKWTLDWRPRFEDPQVYDNFVREYQMIARKNVKQLIAQAQQYIAEEIDPEIEEGDDDGGV